MNWSDIPRPDLSAIPEFEAIGWGIIFSHADVMAHRTSPTNVPHDEIKFGLPNHHQKPQVRLHSWMRQKDNAIQRQWQLWLLDENGKWGMKYSCNLVRTMIEYLQEMGYVA